MARAVAAARLAFDEGPWPRMTHAERAEYLRRLGAGLAARADDIEQIWPRESGVLHRVAQHVGDGAAGHLRLLRRPGRHLRLGARGPAQPAPGSASWSGSRWAWSAPSSRGTRRWA